MSDVAWGNGQWVAVGDVLPERGTAAYRRHALSVLARRTLGWAWHDYQREAA